MLSLKDKLKRDLENAQSRISSLQEQVSILGLQSKGFSTVNVHTVNLVAYRGGAPYGGEAPDLKNNHSSM